MRRTPYLVLALFLSACSEEDDSQEKAQQVECKDLNEPTCNGTSGCAPIQGYPAADPCSGMQFVGCVTVSQSLPGTAISCTRHPDGGAQWIVMTTRIPDGWLYCGAPYEPCGTGAP